MAVGGFSKVEKREEEEVEHKIVKNYKQGGHIRIVIQLRSSGYTATNQVRICQRNGEQKLILRPDETNLSRRGGAGDGGMLGEDHLEQQPGRGAGQHHF